jgi:DNA helicase IV
MWPTASAPATVRKLLSGTTALARVAGDLLDGDERRLLHRRSARRLDDEPWTVGDLVLVDEAEAVINGPPRGYGHVVIDEAQDLSAMDFRAVARRCPSRSMTVLGDLAQATAPGAQHSWDDVLAHLGSPAGADFNELDLGYRVPAPILDFANRLLVLAAPDLTPSRSVRVEGRPPVLVPVDDHDLVAETVRLVTEGAARWTTVGVIVPDVLYGAIGSHLGGNTAAGGVAGVSLLRPPEAKGLEFDAVVVVEPALVAGDGAAGARLLYVALTRAVQELTVLHAKPLPAPLAA